MTTWTKQCCCALRAFLRMSVKIPRVNAWASSADVGGLAGGHVSPRSSLSQLSVETLRPDFREVVEGWARVCRPFGHQQAAAYAFYLSSHVWLASVSVAHAVPLSFRAGPALLGTRGENTPREHAPHVEHAYIEASRGHSALLEQSRGPIRFKCHHQA